MMTSYKWYLVLASVATSLGLVTSACSKNAEDCDYVSRCIPPDAGVGGGGNAGGASIGGVGTGGNLVGGSTNVGGTIGVGGSGTGGITSACSLACAGAKPVCIESGTGKGTCVECTSNGNCPTSKPTCNPTTNTCVGCMADTYCSAPTPACNTAAQTCVQCTNNGHCLAPTPACNTTTNLCVQCTKNDQCPTATPLCDTAKNVCVECLSSQDCKSAAVSACISGECEPCSSNGDCSHIAGNNVCKTNSLSDGDAGVDAGPVGNECVQCTVQDESACDANSCNPATNGCTSTLRGSVDTCRSCVADSECIGGDVEDGGSASARCVPLVFKGLTHGSYCLQVLPESSVCPRPYTVVIASGSISGAATQQYCAINQDATTCEAVLDFQNSTVCSIDATCGNGNGGLCKTITGVGMVCTIPCDSAAQCLASAPGNLCSVPTIPYCH